MAINSPPCKKVKTGLIKYFRIPNQYLGYEEAAHECTMHSTTLEQKRHSSGMETFLGKLAKYPK